MNCSKEYLIKQLEYSYKEIERLNNIIDNLIDIIAISLKDDVVEKAFNMNLDDFKIWIKEEIKK